MRAILIIIVLVTLNLAACTKTNPPYLKQEMTDNMGCIERIQIPVTAHSVKINDINTINQLFSSNNISISNFRYFNYENDSIQIWYAPYLHYDRKTVRLDQYTNGLRIFTGDLVYNFLNNQFSYRGGDLTKGTNLDTIPQLSLGKLRKLFTDNIEQFEHSSSKYKDTCFKAEFGYFNINAGTGNNEEVLVKAWRISKRNSILTAEYPLAYYYDQDGKLIYYDNGIRIYK